ncbi:MAG TPA: 4Fe-4S dicluster domain-containing protein [Candidatus Limnocylindrales bacterium]|nr:4Fe-4S dicluster domain-containing protein [Candidatus Limnocylindrales bacterium]
MFAAKCPGQDTRYWTADDIYERACPVCGKMIEFMKTDTHVRCANCKTKVPNPRFNLGCAQWCAVAEQCLGADAKKIKQMSGSGIDSPIIDGGVKMSNSVRKIVSIDESKCDGCGLCLPSCVEGALQIVDGKARLVSDVYCDGLGNCLGECPQNAIEIIEREALEFDELAVQKRMHKVAAACSEDSVQPVPCCPGSMETISRPSREAVNRAELLECSAGLPESELNHWPIQLDLISPEAQFLKGRDLLIAADCVPFAYADFHRSFLAGRSLVIGCPKLDDVDGYHQKLVEIFKRNQLKSITVVHMEVGCCFGLSRLVRAALQESGSNIPLEEIVIGVDGCRK